MQPTAELESLLTDLVSEDDLRAAEAVQRLAGAGDEACQRLLALLESPNPDHRWWATMALAEMNGSSATDGLIRALEDPDGAVRQAAALGLNQRPAVSAIPRLIRALSDPDRLLARLAAGALAALGSEAVSPLTVALRSKDPAVRIEAVRALAHIDDPAVVPTLFAALSDPSAIVVHLAEEGLNRMGIGTVFFEL
jgi:HEAT repeat protein